MAEDLKYEIKQFIKYWTFPVLRPRRFHAFGVGIAKSGTSSMHGILSRYRSAHEPERAKFMSLIVAATEGSISPDEARAKSRALHRRLWLEFNSSWLNYFMLDTLLDEYPNAKFIFTIRDCYSWLDSIINHLLGRKQKPYEMNFHKWYAGQLDVGQHKKGEQVLADLGLYPLERWLAAWATHNATVLARVPEERCLVVRTKDIRKDFVRIANFLSIPPETLNASQAHCYKAEKKFGVLAKLDPGFLQEMVEERCGALMERYFPEVRQLSDVDGYGPSDP